MTKRIICPVESPLRRGVKQFNWVMYSLSLIFLSMTLSLAPVTANLTAVNQAQAQSWLEKANTGGLSQVGQAYGTDAPKDVRMMIVDIIKIILGFLGIIATVIILFAGFKWMTAGGNEENIESAKKMLIAGLIGLAIILFSYAIAYFAISKITATVAGTPGSQQIKLSDLIN